MCHEMLKRSRRAQNIIVNNIRDKGDKQKDLVEIKKVHRKNGLDYSSN